MRIAWYGRWHPFDGNASYVRHVTRRQVDMGHSVTVAHYGSRHLRGSVEDEDRVDLLSLPSLPLTAVGYWHSWAVESPMTGRVLERWLREHQPNVVHASLALGSFDARLPALMSRLDVPFVVTFHVSFARGLNPGTVAAAGSYALYRRVLAAASAVIAFGPVQRQWLTRFAGVDDSLIREIPNGVNAVRFCPGQSEWRQTLSERFVVGYVGRRAAEKNLGDLCRGFLAARLHDARLVIVGGEAGDSLHRRYRDEPSITFIAAIQDRARIADLMRGLDVFVLPSYIEGMSLSLLEAMASGVTPIATDVGEHHSLVDGCGVLLRPSHVADQIARALEELAAHPERRQTLGIAARARARGHGWDRTAGSILDLYRSVS